MSRQITGVTDAEAALRGVDRIYTRKRVLWPRLDKERLAAQIVQVRTRYADLELRLRRACPEEEDREALRQRLEPLRSRRSRGSIASRRED